MEHPGETISVQKPETSRIRLFRKSSQKQQDTTEQVREQLFNNQFDTRIAYEVDGGKINTVHIKPDAPEGNPVIYAFGWTGMIDGCKPYLEGMYYGGKDTYAFDQVMFKPKEINEKSPNSKYTERNADAIVEIAKQNNLTRLDLLGHSEGASNTLRGAQKLIDQGIRVEEIVLVNPTGFGRPTADELDANAKTMLMQEARRAVRKREYTKDFIKMVIGGARAGLNKQVREEGKLVSQSNMTELLQPLLESGVKIHILQADDDPFLDTNDINGEVQAAAQAVRQARAKATLKEADDELQKKYGEGALTKNARERSDMYEDKMKQIRENEKDEMLITSASERLGQEPKPGPGHLFEEYTQTYTPQVVQMLNLMRTRRLKNTLLSQPKQLPINASG